MLFFGEVHPELYRNTVSAEKKVVLKFATERRLNAVQLSVQTLNGDENM